MASKRNEADAVPVTPAAEPRESAPTARDADLGAADVQRQTDEAEAQGFVGHKVDPTPNEAYTVGGVTAGEPTPETDAAAAAEAEKAAGIKEG